MSVYILSTMTGSVAYTFYRNVGDLPVERDKVLIHGGANIPSLKSGFGDVSKDGEGHPLWTAAGIVTPLTDERYDVLKDHWLFQKHLEQGYVKVVGDIAGNHSAVKKATRDMEPVDGFAQLTPATLKQRIKVRENSLAPEDQFRI